MKDVYIKSRTLDLILIHLERVLSNERRRRERMRAEIAIKTIKKFYKQAEEEIGKTR